MPLIVVAWLAALVCFSFFSMITLYKAVTGAASCGCFGSVQVNPWITLFAIDLPAVVALSLFRPKPVLPPRILVRIRLRHRPVKALIREMTVSRRHSNEIDAQARREGMTSLFLGGVDKAHRAITTYEEVLRATTGTVPTD